MTKSGPQAVERDTRLWPLALGNFAVATGSLIVAGLLPPMARDLGQTVPVMGQAITAFAIAVAIGGPALAGPTSRMDRRNLLMAALALTALGHVVCALAGSYAWLLTGRVLAGVGAGLFTPHAASAAAILVGPERRGRAIALVFIGFTLSTVVGIPLGTVLGEAIGWRNTLLLVAAVAIGGLVWLQVSLPPGIYCQPITAACWRRIAGSAALVSMLAMTLLQSLGQLVLLTYIAPVVTDSIGATSTTLALLFAANGIAGVLGNLLGGRLVDRYGAARITVLFMTVVAVSFLLFPLGRSGFLATFALMSLWGLGAFAINSVQQPRLIAAAPALATATLPLNSAAIYVGQALGAIVGGLVAAGPGLVWLGPVAALFLVAAIACSLAAERA
jgi:predicted MFS family arabinose efflux permease